MTQRPRRFLIQAILIFLLHAVFQSLQGQREQKRNLPGSCFPAGDGNSRLPAGTVVKVYNGRGDVENRIKEGKNTVGWDKIS
jgi:hypothetical protein